MENRIYCNKILCFLAANSGIEDNQATPYPENAASTEEDEHTM